MAPGCRLKCGLAVWRALRFNLFSMKKYVVYVMMVLGTASLSPIGAAGPSGGGDSTGGSAGRGRGGGCATSSCITLPGSNMGDCEKNGTDDNGCTQWTCQGSWFWHDCL